MKTPGDGGRRLRGRTRGSVQLPASGRSLLPLRVGITPKGAGLRFSVPRAAKRKPLKGRDQVRPAPRRPPKPSCLLSFLRVPRAILPPHHLTLPASDGVGARRGPGVVAESRRPAGGEEANMERNRPKTTSPATTAEITMTDGAFRSYRRIMSCAPDLRAFRGFGCFRAGPQPGSRVDIRRPVRYSS